MKVDRTHRSRPAEAGKEDFRKTLQEALRKQANRPTGVAAGPRAQAVRGVVSATRNALAAPEALGKARQTMHREVERLDDVATRTQVDRREGEQERAKVLSFQSQQRSEDLRPRRELPLPEMDSREREPAPVTPARETPGMEGQGPRAAVSAPPENAPVALHSALELVEKIEAFVRSQRPGLALTLQGALEGRVEIERVGPNEVAIVLTTKSRSGELPLNQMSRVRDELLARGLKVTQLRLG